MSERKTETFKFRCTPSFKASLQAAAAQAEVSVSEYIEGAVQSFLEEERILRLFEGAPQEDVSTSDEVSANTTNAKEEPKSWTFEARKSAVLDEDDLAVISAWVSGFQGNTWGRLSA